MDSQEKLASLVHMPTNIAKLKQFSNSLYAMDQNGKNSFVLTNQEY